MIGSSQNVDSLNPLGIASPNPYTHRGAYCGAFQCGGNNELNNIRKGGMKCDNNGTGLPETPRKRATQYGNGGYRFA